MSQNERPPWYNSAWRSAEEKQALLGAQPRNPASPRSVVPSTGSGEYSVGWQSEWYSQYRQEIQAARAQFGSEHSVVASAPVKNRGLER